MSDDESEIVSDNDELPSQQQLDDAAQTFEDIEFPSLKPRLSRQVYLITYAQAMPTYTTASFSDIIERAFVSKGGRLEQWACAKERHRNGGFHFHMAVKLSEQKRWKSVKYEVERQYADIRLHFSEGVDHTHGYSGAYAYTVKGGDFLLSENHPTMTHSSHRKLKKMDRASFADLVIEKNLKDMDHVMALAKENRDKGQSSLYNFILKCGKRKCAEVIETIWEMEAAPAKVLRLQKSRIDILHEAHRQPCSCTELHLWCILARETLENNGIPLIEYSQAVMTALTLGRGKFRNIIHTGESNCPKTFLLLPLKQIFTAFCNPARGTVNWVGVDEAEIILLNDFRWGIDVIAWEQLLHLLEGDDTSFAAPKNSFLKNIILSRDTPILLLARGRLCLAAISVAKKTK